MKHCHIFRTIIVLDFMAHSHASEISTFFAGLATRAKLLSIPTSLYNETFATVQYYRFILNQNASLARCISRELGWDKGVGRFVDDEGCSYFGWTFYWSISGMLLILILLISGIGFGIGRMFCECCCKPCGCPRCGGTKPTTTYSAAWTRMNYITYFMLLASLFSLTIIGSLITVDAVDQFTQTIKVIVRALDSLSSLCNTTVRKTWALVPTAQSQVETLNHRFDELELVNVSSAAFSASLQITLTAAKNLAFLIDGCTTNDMCNNISAWNVCYNGQHVSSSGSAALLSSGSLNPACFGSNGSFHGCPCCANCSNSVELIQSARSKIPVRWEALDKRMSKIEAGDIIRAAASDAQIPLRRTMQSVDEVAEHFKYFNLDAVNVNGLLFGVVWVPGWVILALFKIGTGMTSFQDRGSTRNLGMRGQHLIWTAFVFGILWVCVVVLPLFTFLSLFSIPLSSTCNALARAHEESFWRAVLGKTLDGQEHIPLNMTDIIIDCLLLNKGVSKYYTKSTEAAFQLLQNPKYQIPGSVINEYFSIEAQAAPFKISTGTVQFRPSKLYYLECFCLIFHLQSDWINNSSITDMQFNSIGNCSNSKKSDCEQDFITYQVCCKSLDKHSTML